MAPTWMVAATAGPLLVLAAPALIRRRPESLDDRMLVLWPLAALVVWWLHPPYAIHALESLSLPCAVLLARGWPSLRRRRVAWAAIVAALAIPGLIFAGQLLGQSWHERSQGYVLEADDARAVNYLTEEHRPVGCSRR